MSACYQASVSPRGVQWHTRGKWAVAKRPMACNTGNAPLTSPHSAVLSHAFCSSLLVNHLLQICNISMFFLPSPAFPFFLSLFSLAEDRVGGGGGSVGILAPCALRSTGPWLGSISPLYPLSLVRLEPLLLCPTKHPPPPAPLNPPSPRPPPPTSSTPLGRFSKRRSHHKPPPSLSRSLLLLSPSLMRLHVSPIIHCPPFHPHLLHRRPWQQVQPLWHRCTQLLWALNMGTKHWRGPSVTVGLWVCACASVCREESTHSQILKLLLRVCLSLTFSSIWKMSFTAVWANTQRWRRAGSVFTLSCAERTWTHGDLHLPLNRHTPLSFCPIELLPV